MFFVQVVCSLPGGRLQFSEGGLKMAWLPKKVRRWDLMMDQSGGWLVMQMDVGIADKVMPANVQDSL